MQVADPRKGKAVEPFRFAVWVTANAGTFGFKQKLFEVS